MSSPRERPFCISSEESLLAVCSSSPMPNCNHEKANTRIVVHVLHVHALQQELMTVQGRTADTDVVVVFIGVFHKLLLSQPKARIFGSPWE